MAEYVPMTRDAFNRIKADIERMENVEMPAIAEKIAEARAEGDLKENAEYHAQREAQGMLQAKINQLRGRLANAHIVDTSSLPKDEIGFGSKVRVRDCVYGDEEEFTLVGAGDEDYSQGKILTTSPVGSALIGKKVGDQVEIDVPAGKLHFEVLSIEQDV